MTNANPLFAPSDRAYGLPPFDLLAPEFYGPAFEAAMAEHSAEIAAIAGNPEAPTFANTVEAMERAGKALNRCNESFWLLVSTRSTPELQALERELAPKFAAHYSAIGMNEKLLARVADLQARRDSLALTPEQSHLLKLTYDSFRRAGALLAPEQKARYGAILERLATLYAHFSQNVLADENEWTMFLSQADLDGLPQTLRDNAAHEAEARGRKGEYCITLSRSSVEPFLTYAARRDLREKAFNAWQQRGELKAATDNRPIINEILRLRDESARLLGYESFAHYKLEDQMAKTPDHVSALLERVWTPAVKRAGEERALLQGYAQREGENFPIEAWDWRYYAEKARRDLHSLDDEEIRAYLSLDHMIDAAFDTATKLFGVTFSEVKGLSLHHPDARAFEARNEKGEHVALFVGDYFARPGKRSGAWMSSLRAQSHMGESVRPLVVNVCNFPKAAPGKPNLIGLDDARTLFHEFGHALHGMLSDVTYPSISGTGVARDFVEFPSQLYEHWLLTPEVLSRFARHHETGAPMPADLVERIRGARNFNQGFGTVEYLSCARVDLDLHLQHPGADFDVETFEKQDLERIGMPEGVAMRHRTPHFSHVFSGDGYSSGYYSYLWSEVLDADGFHAFEEAGDVFDPKIAGRLKTYVYSAGGREAPEDAYRHFRGRDPDPEALIVKRGLNEAA